MLPGSTFWNDWTKYPYSMTIWYMRPLGVQVLALGYSTGEAWNETGYSNPDFDAKLRQGAGRQRSGPAEGGDEGLEQIIQDSGIIIQPYWQIPVQSHDPKVKNYGIHQTFQMDLQKVWLENS